MQIEVEIRSFITKEKYEELLEFFINNTQLIKEDYQETYYFDTESDLRIQRNNKTAKIWHKSGKIHDDIREEIEIYTDRNDFEKIEKIFNKIGHNTEIKWFRDRKQFNWQSITISLDYTRGYGYIIELEKMDSKKEKESVLKELNEKFDELEIMPTSREEFEERFNHYKENWKDLIKNEI